jgi:hypothetical protein
LPSRFVGSRSKIPSAFNPVSTPIKLEREQAERFRATNLFELSIAPRSPPQAALSSGKSKCRLTGFDAEFAGND